MSRTQRLFDLIQILRVHRYPVSALFLADELGVSARTIYRDVQTLQAQGADIVGEAGVGYVLRPGFMLPPLMFSEEELEALVLGARWVRRHGDGALSEAARNALAKITDVLPTDLKDMVETSTLLIGSEKTIFDDRHVALIRQTIRREHKLEFAYRDLQDRESQRIIWPFAMGYFNNVNVVVGWCELRKGFRHFRADRLGDLQVLEVKYPKRRAHLLREWQEQENIRLRN